MRMLLRLCLHLLFALFAVFQTSPNSLATQMEVVLTRSAHPADFSLATTTMTEELVSRSGGENGLNKECLGVAEAFLAQRIGIPRLNCGTFTEFVAANSALNPNTIRFSQDSIKAGFQNAAYGTIDDLAAGLRSGTVKPSSIEPIRLVEREGHLILIDNRRLEAFRRAGVDVPNRMATPAEIQQAIGQGKFSAGDLGGTTIRVR